MPRRLRSPVKEAKKKKKPLPTKIGAVKVVRNLNGEVIFEGTEHQWRAWAQERVASKLYVPCRS